MNTNRLLDDREILAKEKSPEELARAYALINSNFPLACSELQNLADSGSVMAMLYLANAYKHPHVADSRSAEEWFTKAYDAGSSSALLNLSQMKYRAGELQEAEKLLTDGSSKEDGHSMLWLAILYRDNPQMDKQYLVRSLLERAAAQGQFAAAFYIAWLKMKGNYGMTKIHEGFLLFLKSLISSFLIACRDPTSRRLWK